MNKQHVIEALLLRLEEERNTLVRAALQSRTEATDEANKSDNKYDTRSLEASYLAGAQSRMAAEAEEALVIVKRLGLIEFEPGDGITIGALVELRMGKKMSYYFLSPRGGGLQIVVNKETVTVLTPQSRLGSLLVDQTAGHSFPYEQNGNSITCRIVAFQ